MSAVMSDLPPRHRITVDEYYRMAKAGVLSPDARVELIDGELMDMAPIGSRHAARESRLGDWLAEAVGSRAHVRRELPIRLGAASEPQPDLAVVKRRNDYYEEAHPTAADTLLVVEVSDTTLIRDLQVKVPLYALHAIPEVWIVDPRGMQIHFFRTPDAGMYLHVSTTGEPGVTTLAALADAHIDLSLLFGRKSL